MSLPPCWFVHATVVQSPCLGILIPFPISTTTHAHTQFLSPWLFDHSPVSSITFHHHSHLRSTFNRHCSCRPPRSDAIYPYRCLCHHCGNVITYLSCWNFLHICWFLAMRTYLVSPLRHQVTLRLLLLLLLRISLNGLIVSSSNTLIGSIALTQLCIRFASTSISLSLIMCLTTPTPLTTSH
ncbi:hypothetical protein ES288_D08G093100v1 [Gossypium darwinii]|uniref:Uncharacterized protein n=1 Tax=Gossypium darwinii TaxID=34276 RepID=A0A5D2BL35_GOSDA|nr:hypothetical protein ES288_D08G093100v1 [Gossypium darwinii]